jgi:hypothetical protein
MITELGFEKGAHTGVVDTKAVQRVKNELKKQIAKPIRIEVK